MARLGVYALVGGLVLVGAGIVGKSAYNSGFRSGESSARPHYAETKVVSNAQKNTLEITAEDGKTKTTLFEVPRTAFRGRLFLRNKLLEDELKLVNPAQE